MPPDWDKNQIDREMEAIPIHLYASKSTESYAQLADRLILQNNDCLRVKIAKNRIYFFEPKIGKWRYKDDSNSDERSVTLQKIAAHTPLLDCTFLYGISTIQYENVKSHFSDMVLLTADKRDSDQNAICFVDYSGLGRYGNDWSWETTRNKVLQAIDSIPWELKKEKLFWRGSLTDLFFHHQVLPQEMIDKKEWSPRVLLHQISKRHPDLIDAGLTNFEGSREAIHELGLSEKDLLERVPLEEHLNYKYQIVLDGTWTTYPGYAWRLLSGCCVFKVDSVVYQWFYKGLTPWVHYIPVKTDLSDLVEKIIWAKENDQKAKEIGMNGRQFALNHLSLEHFYERAAYILNRLASYQKIADEKVGQKNETLPLFLARLRVYCKRLIPKRILKLLRSLFH